MSILNEFMSEQLALKLEEKIKKIDELNFKKNLYEVYGLLLTKDKKWVFQQVRKQKLGWDSEIYTNISNKIKEFDDYLVKPFEVVEGVIECQKCRSKKTFSVQKQTRSSDEPFTTFSRCSECNFQWVYNG